jgi:TonB family protein
MSQSAIAVILLVAVAISGRLLQVPPRVSAAELKRHVGRTVTICGRIVTHDCADDKDRSTTLDLDKPYWDKSAAVLILETARRSFPRRLEDRYALANICATGYVERRNGRYMVRVDAPDQIVVEKAPPTSPFPANAERPCDADVEMPQVIREVKPNYTREAMAALQQGLVFLEALVTPDGSVAGTRILHGLQPDFGLNEEAIWAVPGWRLKPGTSSGRPVPVVVTIELSFRLK